MKKGMNLVNKNKQFSFSVVIPTRGRLELIKNLLVSLKKASSKGNISIEIIIIDDSPPKEQLRIKELCKNYEAKYIFGPSNVREKRNIGIANAKEEIIFFVDSDCEVSENVLREHLKMYNSQDTGGVLGLTEFKGKETTTWKVVKRTRFLDAFSFAKTLNNYIDSAPWGTCTNLSIKKEVIINVGAFDTNFPFKLGGDDTELGIRINKMGYKIKMNPDAIVFHTRETWNRFPAVLKRVFRWGRMEYYVFYKKHKEKLTLSFPKPTVIFLLFIVYSIFYSVLDNLIIILSLPFIWLFEFLLFNSILNLISKQDKLKYIIYELIAQFLQFIFELGTIIESFRNRSLLALYKAHLDDIKQVIILWNRKFIEIWSMTISFISILIICLI